MRRHAAWLLALLLCTAAAVASEPHTLIVAHRACTLDTTPLHAPQAEMDAPQAETVCAENTLAAIRRAAELGADMVELDVRASADGELVLLHDKRVSRTTDGRGKVHKLPLVTLRQFDAGSGQRIPTLEEALLLTERLGLPVLLDLKSRRVVSEDLIAVLRRGQRIAQVFVGAHSPERIRELRALAPDVRVIAFPMLRPRIDQYLAAAPNGVRLWARWTDEPMIQKLRAAGVSVWVTVGSRGYAAHARVAALGVDGIITDRPRLLSRAR